jgi:hypothetical protein
MWCFRKKARNEKIRDPIQGAFFSTEAIAGPAQALVREAIQNSLDARLDGHKVRVRFWLATGERSLSPDDVAAFFEGTWQHYAAEGNGLDKAPTQSMCCPYLVVEDFGTKGLTGDVTQADPDPHQKNPFFLFFRAEGLSAKGGAELGRWGIGKFVFPRSSLASTHFGLTIRHDDRKRLLLGAVTLKAHRIGDTTYSPDALFGRPDSDGFVLPLSDSALLDRFSRTFNLSRSTEPGLSVVVPFVDPEITYGELIAAVARNWFVPLLAGDLEVLVEEPGQSTLLNAHSLDDTLQAYGDSVGRDILEFVRLARWGANLPDSDREHLASPDPWRAMKWSSDLVPEPVATKLRQCLESRARVAVRVPLYIRPKSKNSPVATYFDIYMAPDRGSNGRPLFVREGILVSDVRGARVPEIRALVVVNDRPLATLLGDSESPAHTEWQKDGPNFRDRYTYGKAVIAFVTSSVAELLGFVSRTAQEADPSLTVDFFSICPPEPDDPRQLETLDDQEEDEGNDQGVTPKPLDLLERPQPLLLTRITGGFVVTSTESAPSPPYLVEIRCAYNTRSGNAFRKWVPADFDLAKPPMRVSCDAPDAVEHAARENWVLLKVGTTNLRVVVTGFDETRDVVVRYKVRVPQNADSQV